MGWQWHQLDHMQIIYISHHRPDALHDDQPTASKHSRQSLFMISKPNF